MTKVSEVFDGIYSDNILNTIFLSKVGAMAINMPDIESVSNELTEALKKSPYIYDLELSERQSLVMCGYSSDSGVVLHDVKTKKVKVKIPKSKQKLFKFPVPKHEFDEFDTLIKGTLFLSYAKIGKPSLSYMASEFKNIFSESLDSSPLTNVSIGPSPIHPDFYFVFSSNSSGEKSQVIHKTKEEVVIEIINEDSNKYETHIEGFFDTISHTMFRFYNGIIVRQKTASLEEQVKDKFDELISAHELSYDKSSLFLALSQHGKKMQKSTCQLYSELAKFQSEQVTLASQTNEVLELVKKDEYLVCIEQYFKKKLSFRDNIPHSLIDTVSALNGSYHAVGGVRVASVASIFGAVSGAVIAVLLPLILKTTDAQNRIIENKISIEKSVEESKENSVTETESANKQFKSDS